MTWQLTVTGLLIGGLVGLTGMGGGSLMTPILILVFGFQPTLAIGTDILHGAVFKSVGAVRHRRLGTVNARMALWMFLASAPMSLLGVELADWLQGAYGEGVESTSAKVIGAALVLGGLGFLAKTFIKRGVQPSDAPFVLARRDQLRCLALGAAGGFIVGLTSVGSGTFFALVMLMIFPLTAAKIVGTDIFHAAGLLWVAGLAHLLHGNVDLGAMGWLLLGSVPGVLLGSQVTVRLPEGSLRVALGAVLMASGVRLLEVPGYEYLLPVILVGGASLAVVVEVKRIKTRARPALAAQLAGARSTEAPGPPGFAGQS